MHCAGRVVAASVVALVGVPAADASVAVLSADAASSANPIRRVVSLLQKMQTKVTAEGKKEEELYEKFECHCKHGKGDLQASISAAEQQVSQDTSSLDRAEALKDQLEKQLAQHKSDRAEAQAALQQGKAIRAKEATAFEKESSDLKTNVAALGKAIQAIESGASGTFLQTPAAGKLRRLAIDMDISSADRDMLSSFLSVGAGQAMGYVPQSAEVTGILKEMKDTMQKELADVSAAEQSAIKDFEALVAAKEKEVAANSQAVESKTARLGQTGVDIVQLKEDLDDTALALRDDRQFLAGMDTSCATKKAEWEERSKVRADELVALSETVKILNDDEALELFKRTLPSPALLQTQVSGRILKHRAIQALTGKGGRTADPRMKMIMMALSGRSGNFENVVKMIDNMVSLLNREQQDDNSKKEYCQVTIDRTEDEHKALEREHEDLETSIDEGHGTMEALVEEIQQVADGIRALDKSVAEATAVRKEEHAELTEAMAADQAAKQLIGVAKNRLAKFYSPATYKPAPKRELSEQDRISVNMGGTPPPTEAPGGIADTGVANPAAALVQVRLHRTGTRDKEAPAPPPATWDAYQTKGQESNGVMAMLDLLIRDLDKEMTEMDVNEKESQKEYESFMSESAEKRAADSKLLSDREGTKAELEGELQRLTADAQATLKAGMAKAMFLKDVHAECDWLLANAQARADARAGELESLKNAKAILSGADYAFLQTADSVSARRLRGTA